jgi:hypothetical protein
VKISNTLLFWRERRDGAEQDDDHQNEDRGNERTRRLSGCKQAPAALTVRAPFPQEAILEILAYEFPWAICSENRGYHTGLPLDWEQVARCMRIPLG